MPGGLGPRRFDAASVLIAAANSILRRGRQRDGRRGAAPPAAPVPRLEFDASITLHAHLREAGLPDHRADEAVAAVRHAVRSMRGAGWIAVEYVGPWADEGWTWMRRAEWVTVYRRWDAVPPEGREWDRLRASVEETVRMALEDVAGR